ncbi:MAG: hypothetical protein WAR76_06725 [Xanthobacteraceae bacterium]
MSVAVSDFSLVESAESIGIRLSHYLPGFLQVTAKRPSSPIPGSAREDTSDEPKTMRWVWSNTLANG